MNDTRYMISDASKKLHVEAHVLRYWEDELEMEVPRTELGHRYYTERHLLLFQRIKQLKDAGYLLKAIKLILPKLDRLDKEEFEFICLVAEEMNKMAADIESENQASEIQSFVKSEQKEENAPLSISKIPENTTAATIPSSSLKCSSENEAHENLTNANTDTANKNTEDINSDEHNKNKNDENTDEENANFLQAFPPNVIPMFRLPEQSNPDERMQQLQSFMTNAVSTAIEQQAEHFGASLSEQISEKLLTELDYLLQLRQEQEETRFRQLDETIRSHQKTMQEAAASRVSGRKKRKR